MLISLAVPSFAVPEIVETEIVYTPVQVNSWDEMVGAIENLKNGDKVNIEVGTGYYEIFYVNKTAYISASNVKIKFARKKFWYHGSFSTYGNALFVVEGDDVTLDFDRSSLQSNGNAAIIVDGGDNCTIKNAEFFQCKNPGGWGGGIWITNSDPGCRIEGCVFKECEAEYGGGVFIDSDNAVVSGCKFKDCKCTKEGADVYDNNEINTVEDSKTTHSKSDNSFAYVKTVDNRCTFEWNGKDIYASSAISEGNIWIIAGVASVAVITVAAVVISKKKKKTVQ